MSNADFKNIYYQKWNFTKRTSSWDIIKSHEIIEDTLTEIRKILSNKVQFFNESLIEKIRILEQLILTRAYWLDMLSNPINGISDNNTLNVVTPPLLAVFLKEKNIKNSTSNNPLILTPGYVEWIWASSLRELLLAIKENKVLETYYVEESAKIANNFLAKLENLKWYEWLILELKNWKKISWNSVWLEDNFWGLSNSFQVRVWTNVTNWEFNQWLKLAWKNNWINLDTSLVILEYVKNVNKILNIWIPEKLLYRLFFFRLIARTLDFAWNKSQFIMNFTNTKVKHTTIPEENPWLILPEKWISFNWLYPWALGLTRDETITRINNWTLFQSIYWDTETALINELMKNWNYCSDFNLKTPDWETRTFSWVRRSDCLWGEYKMSIWIGTNYR